MNADEYYASLVSNKILVHHGAKGQRWGIRQYQNADGTLTPLGKVHYGIQAKKKADAIRNEQRKKQKADKKAAKAAKKVKEEMTKEKFDSLKDEAFAKGDVKFLADNYKYLNTNEITAINNRYTSIKNLKNNANEQIEAGKKHYLRDLKKMTKTVGEYAQIAATTAKQVDNLLKALGVVEEKKKDQNQNKNNP